MKLPWLPWIFRQEVDAYDFGGPISALRAMQTRSNIQNYCNWSPQFRVNHNFHFSVGDEVLDTWGVVTYDGPAARRVWHQAFVHTWLRHDLPAGLATRVVFARDATGTMAGSVRIVPANTAVDDQSIEPLWSGSDVLVGSGSLTISGLFKPIGPMAQGNIFRTLTVIEGGAARSIRVPLMRIEVAIECPANSSAYLASAQVREFPWRP